MRRLLLSCPMALAIAASGAYADEGAARATLQRVFPQKPIQAIAKTPIPGVLEAVVSAELENELLRAARPRAASSAGEN